MARGKFNVDREIPKKYYDIGEVATMYKIQASAIRFWEPYFPAIKGKRDDKGNRKYTANQVEIIGMIKTLHDKKIYTLKGIQEIINRKRGEVLVTEIPIAKTENGYRVVCSCSKNIVAKPKIALEFEIGEGL